MNDRSKLPMLTPDHIDSRSVLKGASLGAGAFVLGPFLRSLEAQAAGQKPKPRVIFMLESNGLYPRHIQPKGVEVPKGGNEKLIDLPLADLKLPDPISPLSPFKDRMAIIQQLSHKVSGGGDHGKAYGGLG